MDVVPGGVVEQATQVFKNLGAVIKAGSSVNSNVVKTTVSPLSFGGLLPPSQLHILSHASLSKVFLKSMNDFAAVNAVYAEFFGDHKPARSTIEVSRLPKDVLVEVECIALEGSSS